MLFLTLNDMQSPILYHLSISAVCLILLCFCKSATQKFSLLLITLSVILLLDVYFHMLYSIIGQVILYLIIVNNERQSRNQNRSVVLEFWASVFVGVLASLMYAYDINQLLYQSYSILTNIINVLFNLNIHYSPITKTFSTDTTDILTLYQTQHTICCSVAISSLIASLLFSFIRKSTSWLALSWYYFSTAILCLVQLGRVDLSIIVLLVIWILCCRKSV